MELSGKDVSNRELVGTSDSQVDEEECNGSKLPAMDFRFRWLNPRRNETLYNKSGRKASRDTVVREAASCLENTWRRCNNPKKNEVYHCYCLDIIEKECWFELLFARRKNGVCGEWKILTGT